MFKFGLVKDEGVWNNPSTDIYYGHSFIGYKPLQSYDIFGLISSTDGNFWIMSEDDDHYWTEAKLSEETIRSLKITLENNDFSNTDMFSFEDDILFIKLNNLQDNKVVNLSFHKNWIPALIKTLDIDNPVLTEQEILPVWEKSVVPDRIKYPFMTVEELVHKSINNYPLSYAHPDFEVSKFRVLNHIFNTIGNGYYFIEDFEELLSKKAEVDFVRAKRLCNETYFDGYSEEETFDVGDRKISIPKLHSCIAYSVFEEEKINYPDVICWSERNASEELNDIFMERKGLKSTKFNPYPNFQKEYSVLWNLPEVMSLLDNEWKKELVWFYETCIDAINDDCFNDYSQFPTGSLKEDSRHIKEMSERIKDKSHEQVTKDYGVEFNGDVAEFLTNRWLKTKQKYFSFIQETLLLLKS